MGMTEEETIAYPEWTEYRKKRGLDPLGMQNTSVALYQNLLPGISNVTLRMRYYGFYAWLSLEYANRVGYTNPKTWQRYVRRAEALYALIAEQRNDESSIAGARWAKRKLSKADSEIIAFGEDADPGSPTHYLKQAWGAFGAAYGSQIFEIGIFSQTKDHSIPTPSREIGETLAESFAAELGPLTGKFIETMENGTVKRAVLETFAPMTPSAIRAESQERDLYEKLLFAEAGLKRSTDIRRRKTLLLILKLAQQIGHTPSIDEIRWAFYAGRGPDGAALVFPQDLEDQRRRWWVYQANDLAHICFETLLKFVLSVLEPHPGGLLPTRLIAEATDQIMAVMDDTCPVDWAAFLKAMPPVENAWSMDLSSSEWRLCKTVMQAADEKRICGAEEAWAALQLLATLHNRVRLFGEEVAKELGGLNVDAFRSVMTETCFLEERLHAPFQGTLARLIEQRVINRHFFVALRKLRFQDDYTFLIENDEGRLRLRGMDGPTLTNPRLKSALAFLSDIHLLDESGLTADGVRRVGDIA